MRLYRSILRRANVDKRKKAILFDLYSKDVATVLSSIRKERTEEQMHIIYDGSFTYSYFDRAALTGQCHLAVFQPQEEQSDVIILATELADNPGRTITNSAEWIATKVAGQFHLAPENVRFLHRAPEGYFLITFLWETTPDGLSTASAPEWRLLTYQELSQITGHALNLLSSNQAHH